MLSGIKPIWHRLGLDSKRKRVATYEVRPRKDRRGVDLISDALPFGRLWYRIASDAVSYAQFYSRSHDAVIRVFNDKGDLIETHEHKGVYLGQVASIMRCSGRKPGAMALQQRFSDIGYVQNASDIPRRDSLG